MRITTISRGFAVAAVALTVAGLAIAACGGDGGGGEGSDRAGGLRLHPDNPRYLVFRGEPTALITSGEHYGAVVNSDFDYVRYLDELERHRFNLTRLFSGSYVEREGSFGVGYENPLAPRPGRYVSPWAESEERAPGGGRRYDLERWNPAYFERLKDFLDEAGRRGIVVEFVLFSALYQEERWEASPFNPRNNVNDVGEIDGDELYTLANDRVTELQQAFVRKLVTELNSYDNVYYEVMNEPYEQIGPASDAWQDRIVDTIVDTESELPEEHLIARNYHRDDPVRDPHPDVSIFNVHYQRDPSRWDHLDGVLAFDETGFQGTDPTPYRTDAWYFMLSGGGIYSNLDWSFAPGEEGGSGELPEGAPGSGGPALRRWLSVLKRFLERFDLPQMRPAHGIVSGAPAGAETRALEAVADQYAVYVLGGRGGRLTLDLAAGRYRAEWVDPKTGEVVGERVLDHAGGPANLRIPDYDEDIALAVEVEE